MIYQEDGRSDDSCVNLGERRDSRETQVEGQKHVGGETPQNHGFIVTP